MENTIVQLSKYVITFLMICFTVQSFAALKERDEDERHYILMRQIIMIILMNFICFFVMFLQEGEVSTIQMFLLTMAYILGVQILYRLIYRKASMLLVNNMCMLLSISMIILTRLSVSKAMSQYKNSGGIHTALLHHSGHCPKGQVPEKSDLDLRCARNCHAFRRYGAWLYFRRCEAVDRNPRHYVPALRDCQDHTRVLYGRHAARG